MIHSFFFTLLLFAFLLLNAESYAIKLVQYLNLSIVCQSSSQHIRSLINLPTQLIGKWRLMF